MAGYRFWWVDDGGPARELVPEQAQAAPAAGVGVAMSGPVPRAVPRRARGLGAGGVALADQVVAIGADGGRLAARLPEPPAGGAAAAGGPPCAGQQQAQPGQGDRADHDPGQEQRAGGSGHVVAEHREPVGQRVPAAAVAENSGHADNHRGEQDDETENDDHESTPYQGGWSPAGARGRATSWLISESTRPGPGGKLPIGEGLITAADHRAPGLSCRLAGDGGGEPAEPPGHRPRAADDGADVAGVVGRAPQDRPRVVGRRFAERPPGGPGERSDAGGRHAVQAASLGDEIGGRADALHGPSVHGGGETGRPAHLDRELIEFRSLHFLGEQQRFLRQACDRHDLHCGEPVTGRHQDPERVLTEQQRRDLCRRERGAADTDIEPAVDQQLVLAGHTGLDLVDDQAGVAGLDLVQDLRHRVIAGVNDPDPQRGRRAHRAPGHRGGAVDVRQDLPCLDQEHRPGGGQRNMMRAAFQQADPELTFQPLHLLAQRRLHDVLPLGRPAEMQLLG